MSSYTLHEDEETGFIFAAGHHMLGVTGTIGSGVHLVIDAYAVSVMTPKRLHKILKGLVPLAEQVKRDEIESMERQLKAEKESMKIKTHKPKKAGYVYLIKCGAYHKIGMSKRPSKRLDDFDTMYPVPCEMIAMKFFEDMESAEFELHSCYGAFRVRGEWFNLSDGHVEEIKGYLS